MIYGMIFGASIIIATLTRELIPFYFALLGGIVCMVIVAMVNMRSAKKAKAPPAPVAPVPGTPPPHGSPSPPTTTPPVPAPAPVSKTNWVWPVTVGLLAIVIVIWVIAPMLTKSTAPAPKVAAPKKELRQYTKSFPLEFLGAEHVIDRGPDWVKIQKKVGSANFLVSNIPLMKGAKYEIVFHAARETTGKTFLKLNKREFCYDIHLSSETPIEIAFFRQGEAGNSERFLPRENALQLWADDDLLVQLDKQPYVKMTYWK